MVNSLKHALELPGSSAMNNQDKCDPDWVGWHVFYGVLIPLNIVVGFSCSKTKHRTSECIHRQGADSRTHSTSALLQRPFVGRVSSPGLSHPACAPFSVPTQGQHPWGSSPCPTRLHKNPGITEFCQAPPEYSHLNFQRNPLWVCNSCPKYSNNDEAEVPQKETPCLAKAAHSHDQHSPPEKLVELCCWTAAEDYWLIAFICNSRLNATCISSLPHGGVGLFQYYLKFLFIFLF